MTDSTQAPLQERLATACRRRYGEDVAVTQLVRLSAGASSQTWRFVLGRKDGHPEASGLSARPNRAVLQLFGGGQQYPGALDKSTQAEVQRAAARAGVATPAVAFILEPEDEIGEGFIAHLIEGETLGPRIVHDAGFAAARERLVFDCAQALVAIHRMDCTTLPALPIRPATVGLQQLLATHRSYGADVPVFELAFQWLGDNVPAPCETCLVHGDFRTGNLMVGPEGLRTVLDWEMAHLGDPREDLGWLCVNAWRFGRIDLPVGGFGLRRELYREYAAAGGAASLDPDALRFWEVFGTLQWGVMCEWFAAQFVDGSVRDIERLAIGRRITEAQLDLMDLLRGRD